MKKTIAINKDWEFAWSTYAGRDRGLPGASGYDYGIVWHEATVPGNVQIDLERHGILEDPYYADNADHYRWCEEVDFWYRTTVDPLILTEQQKAVLVFQGLDCFATLWIDGRRIGKHENMFIPWRIDITNYIRSDRPVEIIVRLASTAEEPIVSQRDPNNHPPLRRTRARKAQLSYGWDIGPRLVTVGIWRPVVIEIMERGSIMSAGVRTVELFANTADMEFVSSVDWHDAPASVMVSFKTDAITLEKDVELEYGVNDIVIPFSIENPCLWWPGGRVGGKPELYEFTMELGQDLDVKCGKFGVCEVKTVEEPREDGGLGFKFVVNKKDFFVKGLNWTPGDTMLARMDEQRISKLVGLAADANVNLLRVWGGGVYEPESFLQECDEKGILVWQDFMFACSLYPQDTEFINGIKEEITSVVRAYRGHVSLGMWAGDNEIDSLCKPESGTLISREHIPALLAELDPQRVYIKSSPFSKPGENPDDKRFGDCHLWNHVARHDDPLYIDPMPNLVSEIGRISLPSQKTIDSFIPAHLQWPVDNSIWLYHGSDTNRWGVYRNMQHVLKSVEICGYSPPENLTELIEITQKIQADAYRYWIEEYRADSRCSGIILWNLCDCWPQVSDSIISYDLELKKAYYAVQEAFADD